MARFLVIVSTSEKGKALLGLRWAAAALRNGWADDVRVVLFGPVEELVARGDPDLLDSIGELEALGRSVMACVRVAEAGGYAGELERRGLRLGPVGEEIARLAGEGYVPLVF